MNLFDSGLNGVYETNHLHLKLSEDIEVSESGLSDDRKYAILVHEYIHYYQHFATLYGVQFCKMFNLLFIETQKYLRNVTEIHLPFGVWEYVNNIRRYKQHVLNIEGSKTCDYIIGDIEIDNREINNASKNRTAVKIGVYDYTEDDAYEDGFHFGYMCIIESMAHLIQKIIFPKVEHNQIPYEAVEIICQYYYPSVADDPKQMLTMCICSLMFDNPGEGFFTVIEFAGKNPELKGTEFYREFIQTSKVSYKNHEFSMDIVGQTMLQEYKTALQMMCGSTLDYYNQVIDSFIQDFQLGHCGLLELIYNGDIHDRKQFLSLVNAYGLPYIESPTMTYLPKNPVTNLPYKDIAYIIGFELIFRRLQKKTVTFVLGTGYAKPLHMMETRK